MPIKAPSVESVVEDPNPFKATMQAPKPIKLPKLSKTEQAKQEAAKLDSDILRAQNAAISLFDNNSVYRNGSFRLKKQMIDDYKAQLPDFYNDPNRFKNLTPEQRTRLQTEVGDALDKHYQSAYDSVYTAKNQADYTGSRFLEQGNQIIKSSQELYNIVNSPSENSKQKEALSQQIAEVSNAISKRATDAATAIDMLGDPNDPKVADMTKRIRSYYDELDAPDIAKLQALNKEKNRLDNLDGLALGRKIAELEKLRTEYAAELQKNPVYLDQLLQSAELQDIADATGSIYGLGLEGRQNKGLYLAAEIAGQGPGFILNQAARTGGAVVGGALSLGNPVGAIAGAELGMAVSGFLQGSGQVGQELYQTIMGLSDSEIQKSSDYKEYLNNALESGLSDADAKELARHKLAISAAQDMGLISGSASAVLNRFSPGFILNKSGALNKLAKEFGKNFATRFGMKITGAGIEEGVDEGQARFAQNYAMRKYAGQDTPLTEGVASDALAGAELGGLIEAPGAAVARSTVDTIQEARSNTAPAQASTTPNSAAAGNATTGGAQATAQTTQAQQTSTAQAANAQTQTAAQQTATAQQTNAQAASNLQQAATPTVNTGTVSSNVQTLGTTGLTTGPMGYNPNAAQNITNSQAIQDLTSVGDALLNSNSGQINTNNLTDTQVQTIANAYESLNAVGEGNRVVQYLNGLKTQSQGAIDLNIDDILNRNTNIIAQNTQNLGAQNGTIQGHTTGTATANSQPAATQSTVSATVGQQNTQNNTGSGTAAQSTGTGGATLQNTRASTANVQSNQSADAPQGQRTNSRRDNTGNDTTGSQSDIGQRGTVGTTEQRTGNDRRTEGNGTTEQTRLDVGDIERAAREAEARLGEQTREIGTPVKNTWSNRASIHVARMLRHSGHRVNRLFAKAKRDTKAAGLDNKASEFIAAFVTRINLALQQVIGDSMVNNLMADGVIVFNTPNSDPNSNFNIRRDLTPLRTGGKTVGLFKDGRIDLGDPEHLETAPHEVMHAVVDCVNTAGAIITKKAQAGEPAAIQFYNDWVGFLRSLGIITGSKNGVYLDRNGKPIKNIFAKSLWSRADKERAAIGMEAYFRTGKFPEASGLNELYRPMAERIARWYKNILENARAFVAVFRQEVTSYKNNYRKAKSAEKGLSSAIIAQMRSDVRLYANPRLDLYTNGVPEEFSNFVDHLLEGYNIGVNEALANVDLSFSVKATVDATATALTTQYMAMGLSPGEAYELANDRVAKAVQLANAPNEEKVGLQQTHLATAIREVINTPEVQSMIDPQVVARDATTMELTTDADVFNAMSMTDSVDANAMDSQPTETIAEDIGNSNSSDVDTITVGATEMQMREQYATDIETQISEGATDTNDIPTTEQPWFNEFYADGGIMDENGDPQVFYYNGDNTLSVQPTGAENEITTYGRAQNMIESDMDIERNVAEEDRAEIRAIFNGLKDDVRQGKRPKLTEEEAEFLLAANIDTLHITGDNGSDFYVMADRSNIADVYHSANGDEEILEAVAFTIGQPTNMQSTVDMIDAFARENEEQLQLQEQDRTLEHAGMFQHGVLGAQKAHWTNKVFNKIREIVTDENTAIRQFMENNTPAATGEASSVAVYQAINNAPNHTRGAHIQIDKNIRAPLDNWFRIKATEMGVDPIVAAKDSTTVLTNLHIIEAAAKMETELLQDVTSAQLVVDPTQRANAVNMATARLNAYRARQAGATDDSAIDPASKTATNPKGNLFALYGGKTISQAQAEAVSITEKYGDAFISESVNRTRQAMRNLVLHLIRQGVYSREDVENFGRFAYWVPLYTNQTYDSSAPNDVYSMSPSKMNYHRGGSNSPAVDAYTALVMLANKGANAIGTFDTSRELKATYDLMAGRLNDPQYAGRYNEYVENINGVTVRYINGMAMVSANQFYNRYYDDTTSIEARKALDTNIRDRSGYTARVLETDANGVTHIVPYMVLFNDKELLDSNGKVIVESNKPVNDALRRMFTISKQPDNLGFGAKAKNTLAVTTSAFGSSFTTYVAGFAPYNTGRDMLERVPYNIASTYRDVDGKSVSGKAVAARMTYYATAEFGTIMRAVVTGKPENIPGKMGKYLVEFEEMGCMQSASLRALLNNVGNSNYAYINTLLDKAEKSKTPEDFFDVLDKGLQKIGIDFHDEKTKAGLINKARKELRGKARLWAEMWYAIPTASMFAAMRDLNMSKEQAAFHVTEMMNLNQKGTAARRFQAYFPFLGSIGQTAAQMTKYLGFTTTMFGHQRSWDAEYINNLTSAWILNFAVCGAVTSAIYMIATSMGTDDDPDKGFRFFDRMDIDQFTSLPIPIPGTNFTIKNPLGFGPILFAGQSALALYKYARGVDSGTSLASSVIFSSVRNMSPISGPQWDARPEEYLAKLAMTFTPAPISFMTELMVNKDYFGKPINYDMYRKNYERASDVDIRFTESSYKKLAKTAYEFTDAIPFVPTLDFTPETWKHAIRSMTPNPLRGIVDSVMNDPLIKNEEFSTMRDVLGPANTVLGAGTWVGTTLEYPMRSYRDCLEFYEGKIRSAGVAAKLKGKGSDGTAYSQRRDALLSMGFSVEFANDYASLYKLDKDMETMHGQMRKELDNARAAKMSDNTIRSIYQKYATKEKVKINSVLRNVSIYNGRVKRVDVTVPDSGTLARFRGE